MMLVATVLVFIQHVSLQRPMPKLHYVDCNLDQAGAIEVWSDTIPEKEQLKQVELKHKKYKVDTMTVKHWIEFGFKPKTSKIIENYRSKGGQIRQASDLYKIYAIDSALVRKQSHRLIFNQRKYGKVKSRINLNTSDPDSLKLAYGIGGKFAQRIIKYRKRLGGFYDTTQLTEVYGIDTTIFENNPGRFYCAGPLEKIKLNQISYDSLHKHFYFDYKLSRLLINYRDHHGLYEDEQDLRQVKGIKDSVFQKILPYLDFEINF